MVGFPRVGFDPGISNHRRPAIGPGAIIERVQDMTAYRLEFLNESAELIAWETINGEPPERAESLARARASRANTICQGGGYDPDVSAVRLLDPEGNPVELRKRGRPRKLTA